MLKEEDVENALDCALEWLENEENQKRIVNLMGEILKDLDIRTLVLNTVYGIADIMSDREQIAKAIAIIIDDVNYFMKYNAWMKKWR